MELRPSRKRQESAEFKELQTTLMGLGFYEPGMELQEMRQLMIALQASMSQNLLGTMEYDMEQALKESELDFMQTQDVHNSTMISSTNTGSIDRSDPVSITAKSSFYHRNSSSPFSSPEASPQQLIIEAEVHHELDWSPPKRESLVPIAVNESRNWTTRKRMSTELEDRVSAEPRIEVAKRSRIMPWRPPSNRSPTGESNDSGVSFLSNATATTTELSETSSIPMSPPPNYVNEDPNEETNDEDRDYDYHNHSAEPSI